ncbi:PilX N-terminal domain-containing pilus assembly protein [Marinobacter halophilus]|nr:PilX N-terminal domain-containing pilus assembly protein [Marinobacter halophilus]
MNFKERGSALLMSLVILLVLSLLATSSMQNSIMQERMSNSAREGVIALEAAEAALRGLEKDLSDLTSLAGFNANNNGWYDTGEAPPALSANTWGSAKVAEAPTVEGLTPEYFIEYRGPVKLKQEQSKGGTGDSLRNLNFEGSGDQAGGGGAAGSGQSDIMGSAESMRIVVMAKGPSDQSRKIIESYYFISAKNVGTEE